MSQLPALLEALLASGVSDQDAAELLAIKPPAGSTWTVEVLNSGKADEARITAELGKIFRTPVAPVLEDLSRTLEKIFHGKVSSVDWECPDDLNFLGERQDRHLRARD